MNNCETLDRVSVCDFCLPPVKEGTSWQCEEGPSAGSDLLPKNPYNCVLNPDNDLSGKYQFYPSCGAGESNARPTGCSNAAGDDAGPRVNLLIEQSAM